MPSAERMQIIDTHLRQAVCSEMCQVSENKRETYKLLFKCPENYVQQNHRKNAVEKSPVFEEFWQDSGYRTDFVYCGFFVINIRQKRADCDNQYERQFAWDIDERQKNQCAENADGQMRLA